MVEDKKRYTYMENAIQTLNKNYISLPKDEVDRNNKVLNEILTQVVGKMKEKNQLFNKLYSRVFYGGSYYDGLRVGHPEEFDLDLLLLLPAYAEPTLTNSNIPGFVHLQLKEYAKFEKQPEAHLYPGLANLMNNKCLLQTDKVSAWIEGVITRALNEFPKSGNFTIFKTSSGTFQGTTHKGGPAVTLKLKGSVGNKPIIMDIDLVPCFELTGDKWPKSPYRQNPVPKKPNFFIVPKRPTSDVGSADPYWRLSFQEQERELINNLRNLKPAVKLLKKLRDKLDHKVVASYHIKTIFLWEVERDKELWNNSLSYVYMTMLRRYQEYLERGKIPYYWYKSNDLLQRASPSTTENMSNKLKRIIADIDKQTTNPYAFAACLVHHDEIQRLRMETEVGSSSKLLQQLKL